MFGLTNTGGSCWVNATLQALFRIPAAQDRYGNLNAEDTPVDLALQRVYTSQGSLGLSQLYEAIRTEDMPAGRGIGDSHELLMALCDKLPWLDKMLRFEFGTRITCLNCDYSNLVRESVLEFPLSSKGHLQSISDAIQAAVVPFQDPDWKCEACKESGCSQQHLLGTFPEILVFHRRNLEHSIDYCSVLVLNRVRYALFAVVCFNGGHWWTYGRDLPPGKPWHTFDDTHVKQHDPKHFPVAGTMRLLLYARM